MMDTFSTKITTDGNEYEWNFNNVIKLILGAGLCLLVQVVGSWEVGGITEGKRLLVSK